MDPTKNTMAISKTLEADNAKSKFKPEDKLALGTIRFAQGLGASLRYANELHAVQQSGRLPFLKSSNLHEDVLKGKLGPGNVNAWALSEEEESGPSRLAYL